MCATVLGHRTVEPSEVFCALLFSVTVLLNLLRFLRATVLGHRTVEPSEVFCALLFSATLLLNFGTVLRAVLGHNSPAVLLGFLKLFGALRISVPVVFVRLFL